MAPNNTFRPAAALCLAASLWGLTACTSAPSPAAPAPAVAPQEREAGLRALGFRPTEQGWELDLGARLIFARDDASLSDEALAAIDRLARALLALGIRQLAVEGHADSQGSAAYNQRLSERRAQGVARALVARGFAPDQVRAQGFGASRPIEDNGSELGRRQNRRVTLIVASL